jgi:hypothetical protein
MPLYREDLETFDCSVPGCRETSRDGPVYFHAACHIDAPTWAHYQGDVLTIECAICKKRIVSVVIASREDASERPAG